MMNNNTNRIATALLVLRLSVFLVMLVWTIDKFVRRTPSPSSKASTSSKESVPRSFTASPPRSCS